MVKRGNLPILKQMVESLENAVEQFEEAYHRNDYDSFIELKRFIIILQKKIGMLAK